MEVGDVSFHAYSSDINNSASESPDSRQEDIELQQTIAGRRILETQTEVRELRERVVLQDEQIRALQVEKSSSRDWRLQQTIALWQRQSLNLSSLAPALSHLDNGMNITPDHQHRLQVKLLEIAEILDDCRVVKPESLQVSSAEPGTLSTDFKIGDWVNVSPDAARSGHNDASDSVHERTPKRQWEELDANEGQPSSKRARSVL